MNRVTLHMYVVLFVNEEVAKTCLAMFVNNYLLLGYS